MALQLDTSKFTAPRIYYTERVLLNGATQYLDQDSYRVSYPMLVDYIAVSGETVTCNGWPLPAGVPLGANAPFGLFVNGRWWVTERPYSTARDTPGVLGPTILENNTTIFRYYNLAEPRRWNPSAPDMLRAHWPGAFSWRFRRPWLYKSGSSMTIDWSYVTGLATDVPAGADVNAPATIPVDVVLYGLGVKSRQRRIFEMRVPAINPAAPPAGLGANPTGTAPGAAVAASFGDYEYVANVTNEDYEIYQLSLHSPGDFANGVLWTDFLQFNMLRFRFRPGIGDPFSETPIPLKFYGPDDSCGFDPIWYQPSGGPLLLEPGQAIGWQLQNVTTALAPPGCNIRSQVAFIGRVEDHYA